MTTEDKSKKAGKDKNYDNTASTRGKRRTKRISDSGLSHLKVICHKDDIEEIRAFAKERYEARGLTLLSEDSE